MSWKRGRHAKKRRLSFDPDHGDVETAVEEFLKKGGTITKIELDEKAYQAFVKMRDTGIDDFLSNKH
ncbi:hypothetical protein KKA14_17090 [bacterium]|nr:hypothetical protein [bacterium]